MDSQETCPQCAGTLSNGPTRLVQDNCGHKKCRLCLLNDEDFCKQCSLEFPDHTPLHAQIDCHTAVITYQKKSDNEVDDKLNKVIIKQEQLDAEVPDVPEPDKPEGTGLNKTNKLTTSKILSVQHISFDSVKQLYTCSFCNKSFTGKSKVKYHKYCNGGKKIVVFS